MCGGFQKGLFYLQGKRTEGSVKRSGKWEAWVFYVTEQVVIKSYETLMKASFTGKFKKSEVIGDFQKYTLWEIKWFK